MKYLDLTLKFWVVNNISAKIYLYYSKFHMCTLVKWNCIGSSVDSEIISPFWKKSKNGFLAYSRNKLLLLNGDIAMGIWAKKNKYCNTGLCKGRVKKNFFNVEKGIQTRKVKTSWLPQVLPFNKIITYSLNPLVKKNNSF